MNRRIAVASLIWTGSLLLSRFMGLFRDRVLGSTLGVDGSADVYAAAFRIPDWTNHLLASGALSIAFIPIFSAHLERGDDARAWRSFSTIANLLAGFAGILIPVVWVFLPALAALLAPGFTPDQMDLLIRLTRIILPAQAFIFLGGLLNASLLSRDSHLVPALSPLLYNGGIIAGGLLGRSAEGFAWGVLAGSFAGHFFVPLLACIRTGLHWRPILALDDPDLPLFLRRYVPILLGQTVIANDDLVITHIGSAFATGQLAVLSYAKTLMRVPMGVFGAAMGYAAYPTLTRLCLAGKHGEAYRTVTVSTQRVLFLAFGSQVALTVAGTEIATVIYTTNRITPERLLEIGSCVGLFCVALGAWSAQTVLSRGFYARGKTWLPTWLGTGVLVASLPVYVGLGNLWGLYGLALASSIAVTTYAVLLEVLLRRDIGEGPGYLPFLARALPATALGIAAGLLLRPLLGEPSWTMLDALLRGTVLATVGGCTFLAAAWLFGMSEVHEIMAVLKRRIRR